MKLTIDEYSHKFKMSKEMVISKITTKKLSHTIENDITYILLDTPILKTPKLLVPVKQKTTVAMVISLYQKENQQLKEKIVELEEKIDKLIDDKEQMLRDEMNKIENLYNSKDEQLKSIVEIINAKFKQEQSTTVHEVQTIEQQTQQEEIVELKYYLKSLDLKSNQRKQIKSRFLASYGKDVRVIKQNGKIYLDFSKYDYSDLLE
ncbi:hypothetical protein [Sulfurimonas sp.]|jgi:LytS/YehU family sensor histidine kinase|uniref:hypothetical protein n=1 Tax=Sulfurimonas sp. TaxID=2022749 RepID=UPI0025E9D2F1|nr:hypothetical protein [Sulfurimonas sp.]MBT5933888.1 hypothetical protein [Sulfurimonas sp.]